MKDCEKKLGRADFVARSPTQFQVRTRSFKELKCQVCGATYKHFVGTEATRLSLTVFCFNSDQVQVSNPSCDTWLGTIMPNPALIPTRTSPCLFLCPWHTTAHTGVR